MALDRHYRESGNPVILLIPGYRLAPAIARLAGTTTKFSYDPFGREHVIPHAFGTFGPETMVLTEEVCADCNHKLGKERIRVISHIINERARGRSYNHTTSSFRPTSPLQPDPRFR